MTLELTQAVGFLTNWRTNPAYHRAPGGVKKALHAKILDNLSKARSNGIQMFGNYYCRWSMDYEYFSFWLSPNLIVLESTIDQLERDGVFRYVEAENYVGVQGSGDKTQDQGHLLTGEVSSYVDGNPDRPFAFYALWNRTDSFYRAGPDQRSTSSLAVTEVFDQARKLGVVTFGRYECRWASSWKFFTFWLVPSFEVLETVFEQLERAGDFHYAHPKHRIGLFNPEIRAYISKEQIQS